MYDAIVTVADVEKQSIEQLMLYLLNPSTDILKIKLDKNNIETGSITIDDGIRIYENAKKLLVATAQDISKWSEMGVTCHQSCPMPDILLVHHQVYNEIYIL